MILYACTQYTCIYKTHAQQKKICGLIFFKWFRIILFHWIRIWHSFLSDIGFQNFMNLCHMWVWGVFNFWSHVLHPSMSYKVTKALCPFVSVFYPSPTKRRRRVYKPVARPPTYSLSLVVYPHITICPKVAERNFKQIPV